jgi:hypothetical protein
LALPGWSAPQQVAPPSTWSDPKVGAFDDGSVAVGYSDTKATENVVRDLPAGSAPATEVRHPYVYSTSPLMATDPSGVAAAFFPGESGMLASLRSPSGQFGSPGPEESGVSRVAASSAGIATLATGYRDGDYRLTVGFRSPLPATEVFGPAVAEIDDLALAFTARGEAIVAWIEGSWNGPRAVKSATVGRAGWGPVTTLHTAVPATSIKVAADSLGRAAIAWQESVTDGPTTLMAATQRPAGGFGPVQTVATTYYAFAAQLAAGGERAVLGFQTNTSRATLAFADLNAGRGFAAPVELATDQSAPQVAVSPTGKGYVVATWSGAWGNTHVAWDNGYGMITERYIACAGAFSAWAVSAAGGLRAAIVGTGPNGELMLTRTIPDPGGPALHCREPAPAGNPSLYQGPAFPPPTLVVPKKLRLDRKGAFKLRVGLNVPARVTATGYVRLKGLRSRLGLKAVRTRIVGPGAATLKLSVNGHEARKLTRRHRRGGSARVTITVREYIGPRGPTKFTRTLKLGRSR